MVRLSFFNTFLVFFIMFGIFTGILAAGFTIFKNTVEVNNQISAGDQTTASFMAQGGSLVILFLFTAASVLFLVGTVKWMRPKSDKD